jgi:lipid-A-disaccharide synthase-like uncharacterized protein
MLESVMRWFGVTETWQFWWLALGLAGQAVFTGRWIIQWVASEKRRQSHVPELFWWCSFAGAMMLLIYFIGRGDPVGIIGQLFGWIVYGRNLYLIRTQHRRVEEGPGGTMEPK